MDDARVGSENAVYIGKVLIQICLHSSCDDGASNVRAATGEGTDLIVLCYAEEARDDQNFIKIAQFLNAIVARR